MRRGTREDGPAALTVRGASLSICWYREASAVVRQRAGEAQPGSAAASVLEHGLDLTVLLRVVEVVSTSGHGESGGRRGRVRMGKRKSHRLTRRHWRGGGGEAGDVASVACEQEEGGGASSGREEGIGTRAGGTPINENTRKSSAATGVGPPEFRSEGPDGEVGPERRRGLEIFRLSVDRY